MKISALPFYACLTDSEKRTLQQNLASFSYRKGQIIASDGEDPHGFLYVEDGRLAVSLLSEEGREITLFHLGKGDGCFLSAAEAIPEIAFDVTVEAVSDVKLRLLPCSCISRLMKSNPRFSEAVYTSITEHFSKTVKVLQQVLFCSHDQRLASFLWEEMIEAKSMTLNLTHEQIARHIGSAREVVTRALKRFAQEGIVTVGRGSLTILSKEKLKRLLP